MLAVIVLKVSSNFSKKHKEEGRQGGQGGHGRHGGEEVRRLGVTTLFLNSATPAPLLPLLPCSLRRGKSANVDLAHHRSCPTSGDSVPLVHAASYALLVSAAATPQVAL